VTTQEDDVVAGALSGGAAAAWGAISGLAACRTPARVCQGRPGPWAGPARGPAFSNALEAKFAGACQPGGGLSGQIGTATVAARRPEGRASSGYHPATSSSGGFFRLWLCAAGAHAPGPRQGRPGPKRGPGACRARGLPVAHRHNAQISGRMCTRSDTGSMKINAGAPRSRFRYSRMAVCHLNAAGDHEAWIYPAWSRIQASAELPLVRGSLNRLLQKHWQL
jgi:hypothetical protein